MKIAGGKREAMECSREGVSSPGGRGGHFLVPAAASCGSDL